MFDEHCFSSCGPNKLLGECWERWEWPRAESRLELRSQTLNPAFSRMGSIWKKELGIFSLQNHIISQLTNAGHSSKIQNSKWHSVLKKKKLKESSVCWEDGEEDRGWLHRQGKILNQVTGRSKCLLRDFLCYDQAKMDGRVEDGAAPLI